MYAILSLCACLSSPSPSSGFSLLYLHRQSADLILAGENRATEGRVYLHRFQYPLVAPLRSFRSTRKNAFRFHVRRSFAGVRKASSRVPMNESVYGACVPVVPGVRVREHRCWVCV